MAKSPHGRAVERMAAEIGYVCIHWAWLENMIDFLIAHLAGIKDEEAWHAITGNLDLRQKTQILRALFFLRKGKNEDWYDYAVEMLNFIDNDLRPRRNHLVHASLYGSGWDLKHEKKIIKITKPQAFQKAELKTLDVRPAKIAEARKLQKEIFQYAGFCGLIYGFSLHADVAERQGVSFQQFLRQAKSSGRLKHKRSKPKRPPKLPRAKSG
ncbi:hypothetical protein [Bradyrhizobium sp. AZCC 2289]|uniref:hypothetical protein n=1 Tax=Bradyrhizobium sp. AZCC 2289 TaxID=3117026 RepID=UPI002FEF0630